jgi:hypothetical protein
MSNSKVKFEYNDNKVKFEYTNSCTCQVYDEELDQYCDSDDCFGHCYDEMIEDFKTITSHLFDMNKTGWWMIKNIRLWNRETSGFVRADDVAELIKGMTIDSEWIMRGEILDDRIEYSLSHHDAMGSASSVSIVKESEMELYGLY